MIKTAIVLLALAMPMCAAYATTDTFQFSDIYSVHLAHVGDIIVVQNNDNIAHTIRGQDNAGDSISSGTIAPGQNYTMTFMWPGQFSFYDELNRGNFGEIYLFDPSTPFPTNIYNHTSANDMYQLPVYMNSAIIVQPMTPANSTMVQSTPDRVPAITTPTITASSTLVATDTSNATSISFDESSSTQQLTQQIQTLETTNEQLTNKVNALQAELNKIIAILNGQ